MRCPTLSELPPPPPGKTGWPWTEESPQLPDTMPDGRPWPRVSIVTPSYNQAQFIEETIRSVLLQGYPNLEYIIIDGGSTDESVDLIRKYEKWLAYWVSEPDKGQADAINKGWRMATGEIFAYLNSDDTYCPGAIGTAVEYFLRYPEVGMVYGDGNIVDDKGMVLKKHRLRDMTFADVLCWSPYILQPSVFLRKEVIESIGMTNRDLHYNMDYELWIRVGLEYKMKHIPIFLANAKLHPTAKGVAYPIESTSEAIKVLQQFFSQDLPSEISNLKNQAFSSAYLRKAYAYYVLGQMPEARTWVTKAFKFYPSASLAWKGLTIFLKTLLGSSLSCRLRVLKREWLHSIRSIVRCTQ